MPKKKKPPSKAELHTMTFERLRDKLIKLFNSAHFTRGLHQFFFDWAEIAALTVHQIPYHRGLLPKDEDFEKIEAKYMAAIKPLKKDTLSLITEIFGWVQFGMTRFERDLLGPVYMGLEIGNKRGGQFFTPEGVQDLMAQFTIADRTIFDEKPEGELVKINEPASGSGGMLISLIRHIKTLDIDPGIRVWFDASDVSRNAFNMTYLQLGLLDAHGIVRQQNTISLETFDQRLLPRTLIYRYMATEEGRQAYRLALAMNAASELLRGDSQPEIDDEDIMHVPETPSPAPTTPPDLVVQPPPHIPTGEDAED